MTAAMVTLIYDGECPLCQGAMRWVARRALPGQFEFLPCRSRERHERFPWMPEENCLAALQLVFPDGTVLAEDAAILELLRRLRGWRWLAALFRIPGMGWLTPRGYRWIARHRSLISWVLVASRPAKVR